MQCRFCLQVARIEYQKQAWIAPALNAGRILLSNPETSNGLICDQCQARHQVLTLIWGHFWLWLDWREKWNAPLGCLPSISCLPICEYQTRPRWNRITLYMYLTFSDILAFETNLASDQSSCLFCLSIKYNRMYNEKGNANCWVSIYHVDSGGILVCSCVCNVQDQNVSRSNFGQLVHCLSYSLFLNHRADSYPSICLKSIDGWGSLSWCDFGCFW